MSAARDLAMWRAILFDYQDVISGPDVQRGMDAADGVEAELVRLQEELDDALGQIHGGRHEGDKGLVRELQFAEETAAMWKRQVERLRRQRDDAINGRDDLPMSHVVLAQLEASEDEVERLTELLNNRTENP